MSSDGAITRRQTFGLSAAGVMALTPVAGAATRSNPPGDAFSEAALQSDLETYAGFGVHRSGSQADLATTQWLGDFFESAGMTVRRRSFEVPNHDALNATLELPNESMELLAQPPFRSAPRNVVEAPLAYATIAGPATEAAGAILVAETPYGRHSNVHSGAVSPFFEMAQDLRAAALVLILNGPSRRAAYLNVDPDADLPLTALAHPDTAMGLRAAAMEGRTGRLSTPRYAGVRPAENLIASREREGRRIIVTTPVTGWTRCAGERGPGVAVMRALARWLAEAAPNHSIDFVCTSGHELDDRGARIYLGQDAPDPDAVGLWVHLGAGFAARNWHETPSGLLPQTSADPQRYLVATPSELPLARRSFAECPGLAECYPLSPETAAGEAAHIAAAGYRNVIGTFGAHRLHHTLEDDMRAASGALTLPAAAAFRAFISSWLAR